MGFMDKVRSWWRSDDSELAEEETRMTESERDLEADDIEARKEDQAATVGGEFGTMPPVDTDFERDSERPR